MITLYAFGRVFGMPDASPFVTKTEVLLKISGLTFERATGDMRKAPKGKLPYIVDEGTVVADSTFIRWHLEEKHGVDFDKGLTAEQKAIAWATEKMCEEHLYWAIVDNRWMIDENFDKGPRNFFKDAPAPIRPLITHLVRRKVRGALKAQGMGRHARADIERLAVKDLQAIAGILGDKPFLTGTQPCGADASVFAFVLSALSSLSSGPMLETARNQTNLVAYRDRGLARWFPELNPAGTG
jgi:glutathione S-transferase